MSESESIRFEIGDEVRVVRNIRNDGTVFGKEKGDLLIDAGAVGVVRSIGYFLQDQVIYQVYFPTLDRQIGVRNKEVIDASLPWQPNPFYRTEQVVLTKHLAHQGEVFAHKGQQAEVIEFDRDLTTGKVKVQVLVDKLWVWLDLSAIRKDEAAKAYQPGMQ